MTCDYPSDVTAALNRPGPISLCTGLRSLGLGGSTVTYPGSQRTGWNEVSDFV